MTEDGFAEIYQSGFDTDAPVVFTESALLAYDHRCAITGRKFEPSGSAVHPDLTVFLFQPLAHGGRWDFGNAVVVDIAAASLLGKGILLVDDDYQAFIAQPVMLDPSATGPASGERPLVLPQDPGIWPTRQALAYHRSLFRVQ